MPGQASPIQVQTNYGNVQISVSPHQLGDRDERIHLALLLQSLLGCQSIVSLYEYCIMYLFDIDCSLLVKLIVDY